MNFLLGIDDKYNFSLLDLYSAVWICIILKS